MTLCQAMPIRQAAQLLRVGDMRRLRTLDRDIAVGRAQEDLSSVAAGLDEGRSPVVGYTSRRVRCSHSSPSDSHALSQET